MAHRVSLVVVAVVLAAGCLVLAGDARAQNYGPPGWTSPEPNYYAMPAGPDGLTAAMYPSPRPTPPLIGQTYITYEPLSPHEFLYPHHRHYKTYNGNHQATRTSVHWGYRGKLWPLQPSLTNSVPALNTPAGVNCRY
jgi:hypothetical protein